MQRSPRSSASRHTRTEPARPVKKKKRSVVVPLLMFSAVLALMVLVLPKEPTLTAVVSIAGSDGKVVTYTRSEAYRHLRISEIMPVNNSAVPDDQGQFNDYIEIWNSADYPINLKGVGLSDRGTRIRFLFPNITLPADGRIIVFCSGINHSEPGNSLHARFRLSATGEAVYLYDPNAVLIDKVTFPIVNANTTYSLMEDGVYRITEFYSPGYANTEEGHLLYRSESQIAAGTLSLNEIMAKAKTNLLPDEDGDLSDWVEIKNFTDRPVSLSNIFLSNKENRPLKWKFPDDAVIPPNGYYVVFCSGKDRTQNSIGIPHTNFRVSTENSVILLSDSHGRLLDRIVIDILPADKSYGRDETGEWRIFDVPTPGLPNSSAGEASSDRMLRANNPTGVIILEAVASNNAITIVQGQPKTDYVKLYNASDSIAYLEGYGLSDSINRPRKWQFPSGAMIMPGAYLTVFLDGKPHLTGSGLYHTSFKLARTGGEAICFANPKGIILDKIDLPHIPTNISYGRIPDRGGFFYFNEPAPGAPNNVHTAFYGYAPAPAFSMRGGLYYDTVHVTIDVPEGTNVYYTTDGSIPTPEHRLYSGETLSMVFTGVLRARAYNSRDGYRPSDVVTQTYFVNAMHTLPIISLSIDPDELYNETNGIFAAGPNIDKSKGIPFRNAVYRTFGKIPRPCYAEYYSVTNEVVFSQGLEVSLSGGYSLDIPQKSLKFRANSMYGAKTIDAVLFDDRPFEQYKSFTLRMGGNDGLWTRLVDGLQSQLVDEYETTVIHQAWRPVAVYINGIYWGHYNLRERKDRYFITQHEGRSFDEKNNMDLVRGSGRAKFGTAKEYNDLIAAARKLSPGTKPADLQYLTDRVDVDNLFDFMALEMFFGNTDIGNILIYKFKEPGEKFKWLMFDLDYGLFNSGVDSPKSYLKPGGMGSDNVNNVILVKLLEDAQMRDLFLTKLGTIFRLYTTEHMLAKLDEMVALIEPEMPLHFARWAEFVDKAIISEVPNTPEGGLRYWRQRVDRLRNVMKKRPNLLYGFIQNQFKLSNDQMVHYFGPKPPMPPDAI